MGCADTEGFGDPMGCGDAVGGVAMGDGEPKSGGDLVGRSEPMGCSHPMAPIGFSSGHAAHFRCGARCFGPTKALVALDRARGKFRRIRP